MTCAQCTNSGNDNTGKTLYDKTIARRLTTASRRARRATAGALVLGLLVSGAAASFAPAQAADFAGFTTHAVATPLRVEIYEPAIPIPSDPQAEGNFSYTRVDGESGPTGRARASALWPGDSVGEGLKTFGQLLGLPAALTDGGYPVQVNAQSPGDTQSATQEFLPGSTGKAITSDKRAVAKVGYGTSGDVAEGDGSGTPTKSPLESLQSGDLTALGNALTGAAGGSSDPGSSSPLGALSAVIDVGGMASISSTDYGTDADQVVATATSRLGQISLIGGIVKLDGVQVVARTTSNITDGAVTTRKVTIGGMSIAGQEFALTGDGVVAAGSPAPIPGLPDDPGKALAALGISFEQPKPQITKDGAAGSVFVQGLKITVDTAPLVSKLPALPFADLASQLPDSANQIKQALISLGQAHPKIVLILGSSLAQAQTVASIPIGGTGGTGTDSGAVSPPADTPGGTDTGVGAAPSAGEMPPAALGGEPTTTTPINPLAAVPGLPPLGSVPMWLILGGLLLALAAGWYIRRAGFLLFGGAASTCAHGLKAGIPDLRKV